MKLLLAYLVQLIRIQNAIKLILIYKMNVSFIASYGQSS